MFCSFLYSVKGNTVTVQDAQNVALNFFRITQRNQGSRIPATATLKYTRIEVDGTISLYAFDISPKGFVIVSASDFDQPIIAYSAESHFDFNLSNTGVKEVLSNWGQEIAYVEKQRIMPNPNSSALWTYYRQGQSPPTQKSLGIGPLCTTTWNQSGNFGAIPALYNLDCPYDVNSSTNTLTGCVATAMAQILKYWNYPSRGAGLATYNDALVNGYSNNYGVQTFNFNNHAFDWAHMPDALTSTSTPTQDSAISLLGYACGVAVSMDYSVQNSGAFMFSSQSGNGASAQQAFIQYFKYNVATMQAVMFNTYTPANWVSLIEHELDEGRPVEYQGYDITAGGHTWVCDGYDANDMLHMNWGWGGNNNGYFAVTNLNPTTVYNFTYNIGALIGIQPGIQANANPPAVCAGSGAALSVTGGPVSATYAWSPPTNLTCTTCANPIASPPATTTYTVVIDSAGNTDTSRITVYVTQPHELNYTLSDTELCNGSAAVLSLIGVSGININPSNSVMWHDSLTALLAPNSTTTYHVVTQNSVCGNGDSADIQVHVNNYAPVTFNLSSSVICNGSEATLSYSGITNVVVAPSGNSYPNGNNTLIFDPSSTTHFSISGITSCGSVYIDTFTITVNDSTGALTYALSKPTICRGDSTILSVYNSAGVQITPVDKVTALGNFNYSLAPDSNTTFYITGYNAACGGQASTQVTVNVIQPGTLNTSVAEQDLCVGGYETIYLNGVTGSVLCYPALNFYFSDSTDAYAYFVADTTTTYSIAANTICGTQCTANVNVTVLPNVAYTLQKATVCRGDSTLFTVAGLSGITIYPATGFRMIDSNNYQFSPFASTYYQLEGYDCHGGITYYSFTVNVAEPGIFNYTLPDSNLCSSFGSEVFLNGVINPQITPFNNLFSTDATDFYTYLYPVNTTTYTVSAQSVCGGNVSTSFTIYVHQAAGYILGAASVCPGGSTTLTIKGLTNAAINPANTIIWLNDSVVQLAPTTITDYELTGMDCSGTVQQYNAVVGVLGSTNVVISVDSEICSGNQAYVSISGANNIIVNPAINLTYTDSFDAYTYLTPTVNTTYTVNSTSQCTGNNAADIFSIYVVEDPSYVLSAPAVCSGDSVFVLARGLDNMRIDPVNDIQNLNGSKAYIHPTATTTYTISGTSYCTGSNYSQSFTITVDTALTGAALNLFMSGDTLYAGGVGPYQWLLNGTPVRNANSSFITPVSKGTYTVLLGYGTSCQITSNAFEVTRITAVNESANYQVYPNPTAGSWILKSSFDLSGSDCLIFDGEGRLVFNTIINGANITLNTNLSPGVYLMKILNTIGQIRFMTKLVKL